MLSNTAALPHPSPEGLAHSRQLLQLIAEAIHQQNGQLSFDEYMKLTLYALNLGYYTGGSQKFGAGGDFVTAPEISNLFSHCLARQCQQILATLNDQNILELGAGSGIMACDIIRYLNKEQASLKHYYIVEISAELRQRQKQTILNYAPEFYAAVTWLDKLPENFSGVILANEVLDALPVKRFGVENGQAFEWGVTLIDSTLAWHKKTVMSQALALQIDRLKSQYFDFSDYHSEVSLWIKPWIKSLSDCLTNGLILIIDYGFPRHEYYHPHRNQGTLMCHYRHHAHADPFFLPGLQDITAHVDFTLVAESAVAAGLAVAGYSSQAGFLLGCGLTAELKNYEFDNLKQQLNLNQQILRLTSPAEMGELFKVIALSREVSLPLIGFSQQDIRGRL